jgi:hypothetical protein
MAPSGVRAGLAWRHAHPIVMVGNAIRPSNPSGGNSHDP